MFKKVVAFIVKRAEVTEEQLQEFCAQHLAKYKVPRIYRFLDSLPKNATGKTLKEPLRKMVQQGGATI